MSIIQHAPESNQALRQALFRGEIFLLPATPVSLMLCEQNRAILQSVVGLDFTLAHQQYSADELHSLLSQARQKVMASADIKACYTELLNELNFTTCHVDAPRLRGIAPGTEKLKAASAVYYAHRDCWYANPQAQINLWIPLLDYPAAQTFAFWPEFFNSAVPNNSEAFNYLQWQNQVGFQNPSPPAEAVYPRALTEPPDTALNFACRAGERLLFAASHLHRTHANPGPNMRYSLDLRIVHPEDIATHQGAPNCDNRSQGCTLDSYAYLQEMGVST